MAVKLRCRLVGRKNHTEYRIQAADARSPRDGAYLDNLGWYHPESDGQQYHLDVAKCFRWLDDGAQPSELVASLMAKHGIQHKTIERVLGVRRRMAFVASAHRMWPVSGAGVGREADSFSERLLNNSTLTNGSVDRTMPQDAVDNSKQWDRASETEVMDDSLMDEVNNMDVERPLPGVDDREGWSVFLVLPRHLSSLGLGLIPNHRSVVEIGLRPSRSKDRERISLMIDCHTDGVAYISLLWPSERQTPDLWSAGLTLLSSNSAATQAGGETITFCAVSPNADIEGEFSTSADPLAVLDGVVGAVGNPIQCLLGSGDLEFVIQPSSQHATLGVPNASSRYVSFSWPVNLTKPGFPLGVASQVITRTATQSLAEHPSQLLRALIQSLSAAFHTGLARMPTPPIDLL